MNTLQNRSILLIDDDMGMLRALDKVLTSEGAIVTCTAWAGDALKILTERKKQFDLVITDLRMPLMTGITVVYSIKNIFPSLPVIVLTAYGCPEVKEECLQQGAAAFLEKPLNTVQLRSAIEKVFSAYNLR